MKSFKNLWLVFAVAAWFISPQAQASSFNNSTGTGTITANNVQHDDIPNGDDRNYALDNDSAIAFLSYTGPLKIEGNADAIQKLLEYTADVATNGIRNADGSLITDGPGPIPPVKTAFDTAATNGITIVTDGVEIVLSTAEANALYAAAEAVANAKGDNSDPDNPSPDVIAASKALSGATVDVIIEAMADGRVTGDPEKITDLLGAVMEAAGIDPDAFLENAIKSGNIRAVQALVKVLVAGGETEVAKDLVQLLIDKGPGDVAGAEAAAASAELTLNSVQQFNAAIGQQFGDSAIHNVALNTLVGGGARAAAGGSTGAGSDRGLVGFVKVYGGFGSQDNFSRGGKSYAGADFGGVGTALGLGYKLSPELELGALIGYSWNQSTAKNNGGNFGRDEITDNTIRLGFYGNYTWNNLFFTTSPTFGIHLLNGERTTVLGERAKNDRTGFDFSWYNRAGYTFELPAEFFLTPSYALGMTYLHDPEHSEYGASDGLVKYHGYDNWSLLQNLDVRVGRLFRVNDCLAILPEVWGGWEHEYINPDSARTTLNFGGVGVSNSYRVQGIAQDRAVFGAGLTTLIKSKYEVFGRYDERLWDGGHLSNFTVGLSVKF